MEIANRSGVTVECARRDILYLPSIVPGYPPGISQETGGCIDAPYRLGVDPTRYGAYSRGDAINILRGEWAFLWLPSAIGRLQ
jgi:hypothetical protein